MTWEFYKLLAETCATVAVYALLFGSGVMGLVFVGAFAVWLWDKAKKEFYD
jgi:hypothetical protein